MPLLVCLAKKEAVDKKSSSSKNEIMEGVMLYNTMSREKEPFKPADGNKVKLYTCGPTIYDFAHIGNFRAFLMYDMIKRWLTYCGYDVDHVCNLTDVDDKIIQRMQRDGVTLKDLTSKYADFFMEDLKKLNILPARAYPRATDHIDDMVEMISGLVEKGNAYEQQGSYYFKVDSFPDYGKLAKIDFDNMQDGAGEGGGITDTEAFEKANNRDFALWKSYKPEDGEVFWETKIGKGRPGWHIECSAMCRRYLGDSIDIHGGGIDLRFPHHENEIAQSEAYCGCEMCKYWVHNGFVNINNEKMSKSLGNFLTVRDLLKTPLEARAFRYFVVSSQYRQALNFSPEALSGASKTVQRLDKCKAKLHALLDADSGVEGEDVSKAAAKCVADFEAGLKDDLNTPRACAALFTFVKTTEKLLNTDKMDKKGAEQALATLATIDSVLGVYYEVPGMEEAKAEEEGPVEIPEDLAALLEERIKAKSDKDWGRADEIRAEVEARGFVIKDVKGGPSELVRK